MTVTLETNHRRESQLSRVGYYRKAQELAKLFPGTDEARSIIERHILNELRELALVCLAVGEAEAKP